MATNVSLTCKLNGRDQHLTWGQHERHRFSCGLLLINNRGETFTEAKCVGDVIIDPEHSTPLCNNGWWMAAITTFPLHGGALWATWNQITAREAVHSPHPTFAPSVPLSLFSSPLPFGLPCWPQPAGAGLETYWIILTDPPLDNKRLYMNNGHTGSITERK